MAELSVEVDQRELAQVQDLRYELLEMLLQIYQDLDKIRETFYLYYDIGIDPQGLNS